VSQEDDDLAGALIGLGLIALAARGVYVIVKAFGGFRRGRKVTPEELEACEDEIRSEIVLDKKPEAEEAAEEETFCCERCSRNVPVDDIRECVSCGDKCCTRCMDYNGRCLLCRDKVQCKNPACGAWIDKKEQRVCEFCEKPYCANCVTANPFPAQYCSDNCYCDQESSEYDDE